MTLDTRNQGGGLWYRKRNRPTKLWGAELQFNVCEKNKIKIGSHLYSNMEYLRNHVFGMTSLHSVLTLQAPVTTAADDIH